MHTTVHKLFTLPRRVNYTVVDQVLLNWEPRLFDIALALNLPMLDVEVLYRESRAAERALRHAEYLRSLPESRLSIDGPIEAGRRRWTCPPTYPSTP